MINIRKFVKTMIVAIATLATSMAVQAQNMELDEGEVLYRGIAKLEKCDEAIISFVLNATQDTLKNFSFELNGIYIKNTGSLKKVTSKYTYGAIVAVKDGVVDYTYPWRGENWRISIEKGLGAETVIGEVKFVYVVGNNQIEDLGTTLIELKKVEIKQE